MTYSTIEVEGGRKIDVTAFARCEQAREALRLSEVGMCVKVYGHLESTERRMGTGEQLVASHIEVVGGSRGEAALDEIWRAAAGGDITESDLEAAGLVISKVETCSVGSCIRHVLVAAPEAPEGRSERLYEDKRKPGQLGSLPCVF